MDNRVARMIRLQHAVKAAAEIPASVFGGDELAANYARLRSEVKGVLPESLHEEFDSLFPESSSAAKQGPGSSREMRAISASTVAKAHLTTMVGWLEGAIAVERELNSRG